VTSNVPRFDTRFGPQLPSAAMQLSHGAVAGTNPIWQAGAPTIGNAPDMIQFENQEIPLLPGSSLTIRETNLNLVFTGSIWWRQRYLEESERK
jgi:hypothetical protein